MRGRRAGGGPRHRSRDHCCGCGVLLRVTTVPMMFRKFIMTRFGERVAVEGSSSSPAQGRNMPTSRYYTDRNSNRGTSLQLARPVNATHQRHHNCSSHRSVPSRRSHVLAWWIVGPTVAPLSASCEGGGVYGIVGRRRRHFFDVSLRLSLQVRPSKDDGDGPDGQGDEAC